MSKSITFPDDVEKELSISDRIEIPQIRKTLQDYFEALVNGDSEKFQAIWHPQAKIFGVGNSKIIQIDSINEIISHRIEGLQKAKTSIPGFDVDFTIIKIANLYVRDIIATVDIMWQMIMPDTVGNHSTSFQLVKQNDIWLIVSVLDMGLEEEK